MDSTALVQSSRFSTTDWWKWRITALAFPILFAITPESDAEVLECLRLF